MAVFADIADKHGSRGLPMADDDDLAERLSFRVSTKERARIQDEADREQIRVAQVARRYFRRRVSE
jgi:hypothetical protein